MKQARKKRARKPYWFEPPSASLRLKPPYTGQPTGFENDTFWDYETWLTEEQRRDPALHAVVQADAMGNPRPINQLLNSGKPISDYGRGLIADHRARLRKGKRGPKPTPAYALSLQDAVRMQAIERARYLMREEGLSKNAAFEKAASERGIDLEKLHNFDGGKIGSSRRMKKRRNTALKTKSGRMRAD